VWVPFAILWGFRLHGLFAPDGTPRAFALASPKRDEREVGIELLERAERAGGEIVIGDKGYAGRRFAAAVRELDATIVRPARKNEPDSTLHLRPDPSADRVDLLDLQGHPRV
jgi:hypothetical protein